MNWPSPGDFNPFKNQRGPKNAPDWRGTLARMGAGKLLRPETMMAPPKHEIPAMSPDGGMEIKAPTPPQFTTEDMIAAVTGDSRPKSKGFDLDAGLRELGAPPQRPSLPVRPGPDTSAGSLISQALAGASDVVGAGAGLRTQNLDKLQALQRNLRDQRYQDDLMRGAAEFDNKQRGFNFNLQKLGMRQGADREQFGRGMEEKRFGLAEGGQKFGQDMATKGFERGGAWRTEDLLRDKERYGDTKTAREAAIAEEKRRYEAGAPMRAAALTGATGSETRAQGMYDLQKPLLQKQVEDITSPKGLGPVMSDQLLSGGEKSPALSTLEDNATKEKQRLMQAVMDGSMPRSQAEARIQEIDEALGRMTGQHGFDVNDAAKMTIYNTLRFLLGEDVAGNLVDKPTRGFPGIAQKVYEQSPLGPWQFTPIPGLPAVPTK